MNTLPFNSDTLQLAVDSHHGIYIYQKFVEQYGTRILNPTEEQLQDIETLKKGPTEDEEYIWSWEGIEGSTFTDDNGEEFSVYQNGDIWFIPVNMEWPEDF
jgi:hypothetical protein